MVEPMRHAVRQQQQQQQRANNSNTSSSNTGSIINNAHSPLPNWTKRKLTRCSSRTIKVKLKCGPTIATRAAATVVDRQLKRSICVQSQIPATTTINIAADNNNNTNNCSNCNTANSNRNHNSNIRSFTTTTAKTTTAAIRTCSSSNSNRNLSPFLLPLLVLMLLLAVLPSPATYALRTANGGSSLSKGIGSNKEQLNIGLIAPHTNFGKREYLRSINNAVTGLTKTRGAKLTFLKDYSFEQKNIHFDMMSLTPSPTGK